MAFDFTKEYGLVLEGGGAKGAYQIGVWKALKECGVKIKGVAGVSVGALNGALICMDDYEKAEDLWNNISYSKVMKVNDEQMDRLMSGDLLKINFMELTKTSAKILLDRGIDIEPLKEMINNCVDEEKIKNSPIEFLLGTFSISKMKEMTVQVKEDTLEYLKDYLMASAYFPAFKNEKLHGMKYVDGGIVNNVPVDMLLERGYKNIIVIRIFGIGIEKRVKIPKDVNIIQVAPRVDLGNILEFNCKKSCRNIKIGYYDGLRAIKNLSGKIYYIESVEDENYYMNKLNSFNEYVKMALLELYKQDFSNRNMYTRFLFEKVYPEIASEIKLDKDWTYKDLYIAMLELCAKNLRIQKYKVYTEKELLGIIKEKYNIYEIRKRKFPLLIDIIMKAMVIR